MSCPHLDSSIAACDVHDFPTSRFGLNLQARMLHVIGKGGSCTCTGERIWRMIMHMKSMKIPPKEVAEELGLHYIQCGRTTTFTNAPID